VSERRKDVVLNERELFKEVNKYEQTNTSARPQQVAALLICREMSLSRLYQHPKPVRLHRDGPGIRPRIEHAACVACFAVHGILPHSMNSNHDYKPKPVCLHTPARAHLAWHTLGSAAANRRRVLQVQPTNTPALVLAVRRLVAMTLSSGNHRLVKHVKSMSSLLVTCTVRVVHELAGTTANQISLFKWPNHVRSSSPSRWIAPTANHGCDSATPMPLAMLFAAAFFLICATTACARACALPPRTTTLYLL
jgi:hypothetical protein